jgi:glutamate-5-semialdehyde dehydrogenase
VAEKLLPPIAEKLATHGVTIFADGPTHIILSKIKYPHLQKATPENFGQEYLSLQCSVKIVEDFHEALQHIEKYSSKHSEAIIAEDKKVCAEFLKLVDAACVYANASTYFSDGGVFGLGAEIGISTQKLHARGPFALEKLVCEKWVIEGTGQVR